jgi:hypothetical protein
MVAAENPAPIRFATLGRQETSSNLRASIESRLSTEKNRRSVSLTPIQNAGEFLAGMDNQFEGLLTSAEAGSAFAVVNPQTTMLPVFGNSLSADIVLVFAKNDGALLDFVSDWVTENQNLNLLESLRSHWILFSPEK